MPGCFVQQRSRSQHGARKTTDGLQHQRFGSRGVSAIPNGRIKPEGSKPRSNYENGLLDRIENEYIGNLKQQIYYLEIENAYLKSERKKKSVQQRSSEPNSATSVIRRNSSNINLNAVAINSSTNGLKPVKPSDSLMAIQSKEIEIAKMGQENNRLIQKMKFLEEAYHKDKQKLSEEVIDIRKKYDDFLPELIKYQNELSRTQTDLQDTSKKLRFAQKTIEMYENQLEQLSRNHLSMNGVEKERQSEINELLNCIKELECDIGEERSKTRMHHEEINDLKRQIREADLQLKKEKAISSKVSEENRTLNQEHAQLVNRISDLEFQIDQGTYGDNEKTDYAISELAQARENERIQRQENIKYQELLKIEKAKSNKLSAQVAELESLHVSFKERQNQNFDQSENLENALKSLSSENKDLRREMIQMDDKMNEMNRKLMKKDDEMRGLQNKISSLEEKNREISRKYEEENALQEEKIQELENLTQQFRLLSQNIRKSDLNGTTSTTVRSAVDSIDFAFD